MSDTNPLRIPWKPGSDFNHKIVDCAGDVVAEIITRHSNDVDVRSAIIAAVNERAHVEALVRAAETVRGILNNHVHENRTRPADINDAMHTLNRALLPWEADDDVALAPFAGEGGEGR